MNKHVAVNQAHWNAVVPAHARAASYDVEGFRAGKCTLRPIEIEEVGEVSGRSLLHLQCHFGLDSLSWARLGARVTGVDFSEQAIGLAQTLSREAGIEARFVCSDIYSLPEVLTEQFDVVFTSYGVLAWLPDLAGWADVAARFVKPGGSFHMVELHPLAGVFDYDAASGELTWSYPYFSQPEPLRFESADTYAAANAAVGSPVAYEWSHSLGEIVTALIGAGLTIEHLHEFPFSCYQPFPCMTQDADGWWRLPEQYRDIPMLFSIRARK